METQLITERTEKPKHSEFGVASFIISMVMLVTFLGILLYAGINSDLIAYNDTAAGVLGLIFIIAFLATLVGIGLAIAGITIPNKRKVFAILGLCFNVLIVLAMVLTIIIGILAG